MKSGISAMLSVSLAFTSSGILDTIQKPSIVTWLIDGTNLQCCSSCGGGSGNSGNMGRLEREQVVQEIRQIASPSTINVSDLPLSLVESKGGLTKKQRRKQTPIANVVLVFDGGEDEEFQESIIHQWFQVIVTDGKGKRKDRADDYIIDHALPQLKDRFPRDARKSLFHMVHLVSADKELRKRAAATRMMNRGSMVHPPKFWKQYLPNLQQQQQQQLTQT